MNVTQDMANDEYWHRVEDYGVSAGVNESGDSLGRGGVEVILMRYRAIKHTPKGVWLDVCGDKRFVLKSAKKRFACPTKLDALESFLARKNRQIAICQWRIDDARKALKKASEMAERLKQEAAQ